MRPGPIQPSGVPEIRPPGQEVQARPFPVRAFASLVEDWKTWRASMMETADPDRERAFRARLRQTLPRETYSFGADCPLKKTAAIGVIQFRITCLPDEEVYYVQFPRGRDDSVRTQLELMQPGREITAVVRLLDAEISRGGVRTLFRESSYRYTNQFLERLRELSGTMGEPQMLMPEWVMKNVGSLAGGRRYPDSALREIAEILRTGEYYPVSQDCPLRLVSKDRLDAENTYRLEFSFECMRGYTTSIRMAERDLENEEGLDGPGLYLGELRLSSVMLVDGRLFLDWDSVRNVRALRKP